MNLAAPPTRRLPESVPAHLRALAPGDYERWLHEGYVVVKNAIPRSLAERVGQEILDFAGVDSGNPATWPTESVMGMVEMHGSPGQWLARTQPRVHGAFADLWDHEAIEVTINRANCNVPVSEAFQRDDMLHWDLDIALEQHNPAIQVTLALSDAGEDDGTFVCAPGTHRLVQQWRAAGQPGPRPEPEDFLQRDDVSVVKVPVEAGDLVAWRMDLLHGNGANRGERLRLAAYLSMAPAGYVRTNHLGLEPRSEVSRLDTIDCWRLSPWLPALARTLGATQAAVEHWAKQQSNDPDQPGPLPAPTNGASALSDAQRERLNELLSQLAGVPERPNPSGRARSGGAAGYLRTLNYCRDVAHLITAETGLPITVEPPVVLDALGRRIIGLEPW